MCVCAGYVCSCRQVIETNRRALGKKICQRTCSFDEQEEEEEEEEEENEIQLNSDVCLSVCTI